MRAMASDMSGFQGPDGAQRWMAASGGDMAAYNREMAAWQAAKAPAGGPAPAPAAAPAGAPQNFGDIMSGAAKAGKTQSEDYARFQQGDFDRWKNFLDTSCPPDKPFKSSRGAGGCYEKPTECPDGQGPSGPNETDPCTTTGYSTPNPWEQQGGGAGNNAPAAGGDQPGSSGNPLQDALINLYQEKGGMFAGSDPNGFGESLTGGGIWTGAGGQAPVNPALAQATLTAFTPKAPSQMAPAGGGTFSDPYEAAKQHGTYVPPTTSGFAGAVENTGVTGKGSAATPIAQPSTAGVAAPPGGSALQQSLTNKYKDPNAWWMQNAGPKAV